MQFLVTVAVNPEKAKAPPPQDLAEAEAEVVRGLYMDGLIRQIWVHADRSGAVMIVEAESAEAAAEKFATLPLVREGVLQTPQVVALAPYWGFAPRS
jgi:muconolactone delta-isomerase